MEDVKMENEKTEVSEVKGLEKTLKETEGKVENVKEEVTYEITYETTLKQRHVDKPGQVDTIAGDDREKNGEEERKMTEEKDEKKEDVKEEVTFEKYARMSFREKLALGGSGIPGVSRMLSFIISSKL